MTDHSYHVLFLCTGNSARSLMAEALLNHWGKGNFVAHSAGSFPRSEVHPLALALLKEGKIPTDGLRSKSWDEFTASGAPEFDFVFTLCDDAAELCPVWPGSPVTAHWALPDPAAVEGSDERRRAAFRNTLIALESRIRIFLSLPLATLDRMKIEARVRQIGKAPAL